MSNKGHCLKNGVGLRRIFPEILDWNSFTHFLSGYAALTRPTKTSNFCSYQHVLRRIRFTFRPSPFSSTSVFPLFLRRQEPRWQNQSKSEPFGFPQILLSPVGSLLSGNPQLLPNVPVSYPQDHEVIYGKTRDKIRWGTKEQ